MQHKVPKSGSGPCRSNSCSDSSSLGTSSRSHAGWSKFTSSTTTTTSSNTTGSCWYGSACSPDNVSKLDTKKPEFSGKPEEDAESHILSTRDWMEAHNFPEGEKVRHFSVTLIGEASLWYELLAPLDDDWPALQNKFRWQYSKIGNTPEELFHAWRTFKIDENTDTVDSYVLRMSQAAAMLNYGEMQILENFKDTLLYRLYSTLINVNNLRDAIDLAKRVLTKEKLDRQLTGQSSTPFMRASSNDSHLPQNHHKKGVTFDATETLERHSDCIDRLTSLESDMKITMDRKQSPYKPKIYQGRSRN